MYRLRAVIHAVIVFALLAGRGALPALAQSCGASGLAVQVLGSGGPEMQDKRASTSYLIWDHGKARVVLDAGGGSALRFGESGAKMICGGEAMAVRPDGRANPNQLILIEQNKAGIAELLDILKTAHA